MVAGIAEYPGTRGLMRIEPLADGRHRISVVPHPGQSVGHRSWVSSYPLPLIREIHQAKDLFVCDEIMRDEDPRYVECYLREGLLGYLDAAAFAGKRILDFGCGSGSSTMVVSRLLPPCEIVGIDLEERLLHIARLRAEHFGHHSLRWLRSPSGDTLPPGLGDFDFIMLNAVYEHFLPDERRRLMPLIWERLRPGGVLFLNQTPFRYSPVEIHTTGGLLFINYLPDWLTLRVVRRFCKGFEDDTWASLLRKGIRGATVGEIIGLLGGSARAQLLQPAAPGVDRIDLWFNVLSPRHARFKRALRAAMKAVKRITGLEIVPSLSLAIRKVG